MTGGKSLAMIDQQANRLTTLHYTNTQGRNSSQQEHTGNESRRARPVAAEASYTPKIQNFHTLMPTRNLSSGTKIISYIDASPHHLSPRSGGIDMIPAPPALSPRVKSQLENLSVAMPKHGGREHHPKEILIPAVIIYMGTRLTKDPQSLYR